MSNSEAFGPFTYPETLTFVRRVIGQSDSRNHRFDVETAAEDLTGRVFDSVVLWQTLEAVRVDKTNRKTYNATVGTETR